jgi:hypothetical protein
MLPAPAAAKATIAAPRALDNGALFDRPWARWGAFAVIVAVAAALRFRGLGEWSYWSDEAFTISDSNSLYMPSSTDRLPAHRLSFLLYGFWFRAAEHFGIPFSETVARLLPAIFGVLGVACVGWLGARAAGKGGALLAALLVALSPFHLYWSQNARSYALEVVLALPAALLLGSACWRWKTWEFVMGLTLLLAAAFAHPTALTLAPGLLVFFLFARRARETPGAAAHRLWLAAAAAVGFAVVALTPLGRSVWVHFQVKSGASPALFVSTCVYYFRPTLLAAAFFLGIRGIARRDAPAVFLTCAGFGVLASGFAASCLVRTNAQYVIVALPLLTLLAGREIFDLAREGGRPARLAAAALAAVLAGDFAGGAYLYHTAESGHRAPWREACQYVFERQEPGDLVVSTQSTVVECYLNPENSDPRNPRASLYINKFESNLFEVATKFPRRAWFLVLDVDLEEWGREDRARITRFLREECRLMHDWNLQFAGKNQTLRVWRYDPSR